MIRKQLTILFLLLTVVSWAGVLPTTYYNNAQGKAGNNLKLSLHDIIDGHRVQSYTPGVWTAMKTTDVKADGSVWDMYSDVPDGTADYTYVFINDQCGSYSGEGSCYNREHSFPQSWFSSASPMVTDLFHIVPTDGYVNNRRSSFPYGEVGTATWTSTNGSKLGPSVTDGYSGTVFEPIDEYKGDFARGYFYMATRYYGEDGSWPGSSMVNGAEPKDWALAMLKQWHIADPVSQKELDRNDAIYDIQGNRNPFIDHPEYVDSVWNGDSSEPVVEPVIGTTITMENSDYISIIHYVNDNNLPNSSTYADSEYYYGASAFYSYFDIRDGRQHSSFSSSDDAIEEAIVNAVLPSNAPTAVPGDNFNVIYTYYNGANNEGTMSFHCSSSDPLTFVRGLSTSLEQETIETFVIYPNPATMSFAISKKVTDVAVLSTSGQVLLQKSSVNANEHIDLSNIKPGLYLVRVSLGDKVSVQKLVRQ